jgi:hypothetical protein
LAHGSHVESLAGTGAELRGPEFSNHLFVAPVGQPPDQFYRLRRGAIVREAAARHHQLFGGSRTPVDTDPDLVADRIAGQGDVGDERTQETLPVLVGGGRRGPQLWQILRQRLQFGTCWQRCLLHLYLSGRQRGFRFDQRCELRFPPVFQTAGDQAILGLTEVEGALGPFCLVARSFHLQVEHPGGACPTLGHLVSRRQRQSDLVRLNHLQESPADCAIHDRCSERTTASLATGISVGARTRVGRASGGIVACHGAPAATAEDYSLEESGALAGWPGSALGVVGSQAHLVGQESIPADVARMMALQHDRPFLAWRLDLPGVDDPVAVDPALIMEAAEDVRSGVGRIGQQLHRPPVGQAIPTDLAGPSSAICSSREGPVMEGADHAIGGAGGRERAEHVGHRSTDLLVGINHDLASIVVDVAGRERTTKFSAASGGLPGLLQTARQDVQLGLGHRSLQAQEEPVVEVPQVVDAIAIDDQGIGQVAELEQSLEVGGVAGQARHLEAQDGTYLAHADPAHQVLEAWPKRRAATRETEVAVDHENSGGIPAETKRFLGERVLAAGGLGVLAYLGQRRLADVDHRQALQVMAHDLARAAHGRNPP